MRAQQHAYSLCSCHGLITLTYHNTAEYAFFTEKNQDSTEEDIPKQHDSKSSFGMLLTTPLVSPHDVTTPTPTIAQKKITSSTIAPTLSPTPVPTSTPTPIVITRPTPTHTPVPTPTPVIQITYGSKSIHLYPAFGLSDQVRINKLYILPVFFVASDQQGTIKPEWNSNLFTIFSNMKAFFEKQFGYNVEITYPTNITMVKGQQPIRSYDASTLAQEAILTTAPSSPSDRYTVWMIYVIRDATGNTIQGNGGGVPSLQSAVQYEFWLDDEAIHPSEPYGTVGSAHEFGHVLGIVHPWDLPSNTARDPNYGNVPGDLMGYSNSHLSLDKLYLRDDVKRAMGL